MTKPQATSSNPLDVALLQAVRTGDVPGLKKAISDGADVEATEIQGKSALYLAAEHALPACVQILVEAGARVNRRVAEAFNKIERTPLNQACRNMEWDIAHYLLDNGADPRITNDLHETPAHIVLKFITRDPEQLEPQELQGLITLLEKLMNAGNPPNQTTADGQTLLRMMAENLDRTKSREDLALVFDILLRHGSDPNVHGADGRNPLQRLWTEPNLEVLRKFIASGGNLSGRDAEGASVLRYADDVSALQVMIEHGGDIHHIDDMGQNVLLRQLRDEGLSISGDLEQRLALLIENGANPHQKDLTNESFMDVLVALDNEPARRLIALHGAKVARDSINDVIRRRQPQPGT